MTVTIDDLVNTVTTMSTTQQALLDAVNVQKSFIDNAVTSSSSAASATALNAASVSAVNAIAQAAATLANSYAVQANTARDQATAAWAASMNPAEVLPQISNAMYPGGATTCFIYDTSKDTDGGAWRKRCAQTSWYNETLCTGKWLGSKATLAAAWATTGAAVGDFYQNTTDKGYYTITGSVGTPTQTAVYRGNTKQFPALVAVVGTSSRVVIYDLTKPDTPMWMVFTLAANNWLTITTPVTCITMLNGELVVASNVQSMVRINFISDSGLLYFTLLNKLLGDISKRNSAPSYVAISNGVTIPNRLVWSLLSTVVEGTPIDIATGLPITTLVVGLVGGVSVIKPDGSIVTLTVTANTMTGLILIKDRLLITCAAAGRYVAEYVLSSLASHTISALDVADAARSALYSPITIPALQCAGNTNVGLANNGEQISAGGSTGFNLLQRNPATPAASMVAHITNAWNSGWMLGDIRACWLSDIVAETLATAPELITNGDFATNVSGWTPGNSATFTFSSGAGLLTNSASGTLAGFVYQAITTVVGEYYTIACDFIKGSASAGYIAAWTGPNSGTNLGQYGRSTTGRNRLTFQATGTTTYIMLYPGSTSASVTGTFDNITCKLAEKDRSIKNLGLSPVGTITKSEAASGAQLMAYSGFSTTNYLEQTYTTELDLGAAEFSFAVWFKPTAIHDGTILDYAATGTTARLVVRTINNGGVLFYTMDSAGAVTNASSAASSYVTGAWNHLVCVRKANGDMLVYINGKLAGTVSGTARNISLTNGAVRIGCYALSPAVVFQGALSLMRISATAATDAQIAQMYDDEFPLFQDNAKCLIDGTSNSVLTLDADEDTSLVHVGTSWGRSAFQGLRRVDSEATTVGSLTQVSAKGGAVLTAGASAANYYQPSLLLRDELLRKEKAAKALGQVPVFFDTDFLVSQTTFTLPQGYTAKAVYVAGTLKRKGSSQAYTTTSDGYAETVVFTAAPGVSWVSVMAIRA